MTSNGIKYDKDKPPIADFLLDFKKPLFELCKIYKFGCDKYGRNNFKAVEDGQHRFMNAQIRHFFKTGNDEETGISHLAHNCYNALMQLHFELEKKKNEQISCKEDNR